MSRSWPGVVGKGDGGEPPIDLDTMLDLTAAAEVDGVKFDGVDLFLYEPHINIDISDDELKRWAQKFQSRDLVVGTVVAPIWEPTGGGSSMDEGPGRQQFLTQVRKGCHIAKTLRELGVRPFGNVRLDSACGVGQWAADPDGVLRWARRPEVAADAWRIGDFELDRHCSERVEIDQANRFIAVEDDV